MADEGERNRLVAEFSGVTDVDVERAQFYLESSGWDLNLALSSFYDTMGDEDDSVVHETPEETHKQPSSKPRQNVPSHAGRNVASLASIEVMNTNLQQMSFSPYFCSLASGQQILGPPRKKQTSDDVTQSIFDEAKRHGAEVVGDEDIAGPSVRHQPAFKGAGYRLGDTEAESSQPLPETISNRQSNSQQQTKEVVLKFWSNGFSVDDGPLRSFEDPANEQFLNSVKRGEIPQELLRQSRRGEVHVNMEDHRHEDYVPPPKPKVQAFSGAGHKLGSPAPQVKFSHSTEQQAAQADSKPAVPATPLDESQPVTSIQIRLADGTRMVSKFNHSHTVGDIRRFICASRPQMAGMNFVLMTTFPNKELMDDSQKLSEAKLLNAVIVQRLK
ncbi:NSFL1 cofactor p47-like [Orbicella faveolata]|uniref:NSFL1 cofactor p47-like n=1 Tax=Orbicella faveolata TaxID=48498 RepID=UPI0009E3579B|nr:NSFL1 cofactor p47-like [Orbicella faveolata]